MKASSGSGDPGLTGSKICFCEATFLRLSLRCTLLKTQGWMNIYAVGPFCADTGCFAKFIPGDQW